VKKKDNFDWSSGVRGEFVDIVLVNGPFNGWRIQTSFFGQRIMITTPHRGKHWYVPYSSKTYIWMGPA
jgi:hypothetical protein